MNGLLVRHPVLPENLAGTATVMEFIAKKISLNTYMNIMDQYYPCYKGKGHLFIPRIPTLIISMGYPTV